MCSKWKFVFSNFYLIEIPKYPQNHAFSDFGLWNIFKKCLKQNMWKFFKAYSCAFYTKRIFETFTPLCPGALLTRVKILTDLSLTILIFTSFDKNCNFFLLSWQSFVKSCDTRKFLGLSFSSDLVFYEILLTQPKEERKNCHWLWWMQLQQPCNQFW